MFWIIFTIILSLLTISIHELGHAWAIRRCNVSIEEISLLGIKLPRVPSLSFAYTFKGARKPTKISVHPFLIGAFVSPSETGMNRLTTKETAFVYGAGPFVNFVYCLIAFGLLSITTFSPGGTIVGAVCFSLAALLIVFRVFFCRYGVLAIGVVLAGFILASLLTAPAEVSGGMGGPVTIISEMSNVYQTNASAENQFRGAVYISILVSLILGTTNALPIPPFDGGQIAGVYLSAWNKKLGMYFTVFGGILFLLLIFSALSNDVRRLFGG